MIQFCDLNSEYTDWNNSSIVIVPVPYDKTSTWQKGSDKGPEALLLASSYLELYDIETDFEVYKIGIHTAPPLRCDSGPEKLAQLVADTTREYLNSNKFIVLIGGEHSISIGSIQAHVEKYDNLSVLQLDAHADLRDEYNGSHYNHACVMARAMELCHIVQVGIRSMDKSELSKVEKSCVFFSEQIYEQTTWMDQAIRSLNDNVYISIDLDVFDPSIMPGTGTPEPGGLFWYPTLNFLKKVIMEKNVVGIDIVELWPIEGNQISEFTAAKLLYKILSYQFCEIIKTAL